VAFHTGSDKVTDLAGAAALVVDGALVALGGGLSSRLPMALVRQLIRRGTSGLHVVGSAHSIDVDLLVAADAIAVCEESYVGYEQDCCDTLLTQLRAAEMGLPFLPVRGVRGTDIPRLHPEYGQVTCPFTGELLTVVPPLRPDVALVHAPLGDAAGNLHLEQPYVLDERFAMASAAVVATVERLAPTAEVVHAGITVPAHRVAAVAEVPWGAHPTSCAPVYPYDRAHIATWVAAAATDVGAKGYLEEHVLGTDEAGYLELIGADALHALRTWTGSIERWREVLA
jgi:glutaconate CoA-transferase subunit A